MHKEFRILTNKGKDLLFHRYLKSVFLRTYLEKCSHPKICKNGPSAHSYQLMHSAAEVQKSGILGRFYDIKLSVSDSRASKVDAKMAILTAIWCFCFGRLTDATVVVRAGAQRQRQCDWLSLKASEWQTKDFIS